MARSSADRSELHWAVINRDLVRVGELLDSGADPNVKDFNGYTPLHFAAQEYQVEVAKLILQSGARVDVEDSYGNTPLSRATFDSRGRGELIRLLLEAGADRHHKNKAGVSPLDLANRIANYNVAQFYK